MTTEKFLAAARTGAAAAIAAADAGAALAFLAAAGAASADLRFGGMASAETFAASRTDKEMRYNS